MTKYFGKFLWKIDISYCKEKIDDYFFLNEQSCRHLLNYTFLKYSLIKKMYMLSILEKYDKIYETKNINNPNKSRYKSNSILPTNSKRTTKERNLRKKTIRKGH